MVVEVVGVEVEVVSLWPAMFLDPTAQTPPWAVRIRTRWG